MRLRVCMLLLLGVSILGCEKPKPGATTESGPPPVVVPPKEDDEPTKEQKAKDQAQRLKIGVQLYRQSNMKWPDALADMGSILKGGNKELLDPWGKEYQFKVIITKDKRGAETGQVYVWTERVVGDETKLYGEKPPEKKDS